MNNASTDWMSAVAILAGGLILGLLFVYFFRRNRTAAIEGDLERRDLEAKRDALVAQLRTLDPEADDERRRLEAETAAVLRELDRRGPAAAAGAPEASRYQPSKPKMSPALQGFLWGAGSFTLLAVLAYFVMKQSTPRQEGMEATGGFPGQGQQQTAPPQQASPAANPMIAQLEAAVQREPNNLQLRDDLAQAYLETDNLMGVFEQTKFVLDRNPDDFRALTLQALVRMAMGEQAVALQMLEKSSSIEPKNLDTWVSLAWVHMQSGNEEKAEAAIARASAVSPADKPRLEQVFGEMKAAAAAQRLQQQQAQGGTPGGALPEGHPPVGDAPAPAAAPAPASGPAIRITLDVEAGARARITRDGVLFVIARTAPGTPPVAVKRVVPTGFPMTVELSSADSMMGQTLPGKVRVEARFDSDRDAATRPPTDPSAAQDGVTLGSAITLALK